LTIEFLDVVNVNCEFVNILVYILL
jgi:hypothetical protein